SSSFGDITLDSFTAGSLSLSLSSGDFIGGDIEVNNNIQFKNSNGDGTFSGTKAESLNMQSSNGDITINDSTINSVNLQDSNGKISSDKLTTGAIVANLSNGSINLSGDFTGNLDIKSTNGGISLTTWEKQSYYLCDFKTSLGSIKLGGSKSGNIYTNNSKSTNIFKIRNSNGDITVNFAEE
ncbi:MAG: DUF4097 domain-containing protein, partial [Clostridiales bacterium]|nr:DUF4097 domain-containing protein [Clostridiales bacterium]